MAVINACYAGNITILLQQRNTGNSGLESKQAIYRSDYVYCLHQLDDRSVTVLLSMIKKRRFLARISQLNDSLGIPRDYARARCLPVQVEATRLVSIGPDIYDREQKMLSGAARALQSMQQAASGDGVEIQVVSAFRSVEYQCGIIRRKLEQGQDIERILQVSAAPGFSEHHSGRAVDVTTPGYPVLEEEFELSEAFAWLTGNAAEFSFRMSFPRENPHGVAYEPWHWAWTA